METLGPFTGIYRVILGGYIGVIGIMEKKMEATIVISIFFSILPMKPYIIPI